MWQSHVDLELNIPHGSRGGLSTCGTLHVAVEDEDHAETGSSPPSLLVFLSPNHVLTDVHVATFDGQARRASFGTNLSADITGTHNGGDDGKRADACDATVSATGEPRRQGCVARLVAEELSHEQIRFLLPPRPEHPFDFRGQSPDNTSENDDGAGDRADSAFTKEVARGSSPSASDADNVEEGEENSEEGSEKEQLVFDFGDEEVASEEPAEVTTPGEEPHATHSEANVRAPDRDDGPSSPASPTGADGKPRLRLKLFQSTNRRDTPPPVKEEPPQPSEVPTTLQGPPNTAIESHKDETAAKQEGKGAEDTANAATSYVTACPAVYHALRAFLIELPPNLSTLAVEAEMNEAPGQEPPHPTAPSSPMSSTSYRTVIISFALSEDLTDNDETETKRNPLHDMFTVPTPQRNLPSSTGLDSAWCAPVTSLLFGPPRPSPVDAPPTGESGNRADPRDDAALIAASALVCPVVFTCERSAKQSERELERPDGVREDNTVVSVRAVVGEPMVTSLELRQGSVNKVREVKEEEDSMHESHVDATLQCFSPLPCPLSHVCAAISRRPKHSLSSSAAAHTTEDASCVTRTGQTSSVAPQPYPLYAVPGSEGTAPLRCFFLHCDAARWLSVLPRVLSSLAFTRRRGSDGSQAPLTVVTLNRANRLLALQRGVMFLGPRTLVVTVDVLAAASVLLVPTAHTAALPWGDFANGDLMGRVKQVRAFVTLRTAACRLQYPLNAFESWRASCHALLPPAEAQRAWHAWTRGVALQEVYLLLSCSENALPQGRKPYHAPFPGVQHPVMSLAFLRFVEEERWLLNALSRSRIDTMAVNATPLETKEAQLAASMLSHCVKAYMQEVAGALFFWAEQLNTPTSAALWEANPFAPFEEDPFRLALMKEGLIIVPAHRASEGTEATTLFRSFAAFSGTATGGPLSTSPWSWRNPVTMPSGDAVHEAPAVASFGAFSASAQGSEEHPTVIRVKLKWTPHLGQSTGGFDSGVVRNARSAATVTLGSTFLLFACVCPAPRHLNARQWEGLEDEDDAVTHHGSRQRRKVRRLVYGAGDVSAFSSVSSASSDEEKRGAGTTHKTQSAFSRREYIAPPAAYFRLCQRESLLWRVPVQPLCVRGRAQVASVLLQNNLEVLLASLQDTDDVVSHLADADGDLAGFTKEYAKRRRQQRQRHCSRMPQDSAVFTDGGGCDKALPIVAEAAITSGKDPSSEELSDNDLVLELPVAPRKKSAKTAQTSTAAAASSTRRRHKRKPPPPTPPKVSLFTCASLLEEDWSNGEDEEGHETQGPARVTYLPFILPDTMASNPFLQPADAAASFAEQFWSVWEAQDMMPAVDSGNREPPGHTRALAQSAPAQFLAGCLGVALAALRSKGGALWAEVQRLHVALDQQEVEKPWLRNTTRRPGNAFLQSLVHQCRPATGGDGLRALSGPVPELDGFYSDETFVALVSLLQLVVSNALLLPSAEETDRQSNRQRSYTKTRRRTKGNGEEEDATHQDTAARTRRAIVVSVLRAAHVRRSFRQAVGVLEATCIELRQALCNSPTDATRTSPVLQDELETMPEDALFLVLADLLLPSPRSSDSDRVRATMRTELYRAFASSTAHHRGRSQAAAPPQHPPNPFDQEEGFLMATVGRRRKRSYPPTDSRAPRPRGMKREIKAEVTGTAHAAPDAVKKEGEPTNTEARSSASRGSALTPPPPPPNAAASRLLRLKR